MSVTRNERTALNFLKKRTKRSFLFQIIFIILFFLSMNFYPFAEQMENLRNFVLSCQTEALIFFENSFQKVKNFSNFFSDEFFKETASLNKEVESYRYELSMSKTLKEENYKLKSLLELKNQNPSSIAAEVLDIFSNEFNMSMVINVGLSDHVYEDDIVCNNLGLIGRVIEAKEKWSRVLLITDSNSNIPVRIAKANAILSGTNSEFLKISTIHEDIKIEENEKVETSGYGNVFKDGILVGRIIKLKNKFFVRPNVKFYNLKYVIVLRKKCK